MPAVRMKPELVAVAFRSDGEQEGWIRCASGARQSLAARGRHRTGGGLLVIAQTLLYKRPCVISTHARAPHDHRLKGPLGDVASPAPAATRRARRRRTLHGLDAV